MKSNVAKYYTHLITGIILAMFTTGAILQAFLLETGLTEESVNILTSLMQVVQVAVMVGLSKKLDGSTRIVGISAYARLGDLPLLMVLLTLTAFIPEDKNILCIVMAVMMVLYGIGIGITNISTYKLPYLIIDVNHYGKITGVSGMIGGVLTFLLSAGISFLQKRYDYFWVMRGTFAIALVTLMLYLLSTATLKGNYEMMKADAKEAGKANILKYKPFVYLIIPNLLRGFNAGIISLAVTIGYYVELIDGVTASVMVGVSTVASILSCFIYANISQKVRDGVTLLISSIAVCLALPMMLFGNSTVVFIIFYAVLYFFYNVINYAVPATVVKFVDYEVIGQYSAGRMILQTAGMALAGFVCVAMFRLIGPLATLIFAGLCQLISGIGYYVFLKNI